MSALRFTLTDGLPRAVDVSPLVPERLAGMTLAAIREIELASGTERLQAGRVFSVSGQPGPRVEIHGGSDRLIRLGAGMTEGSIVVEGDAGDYLGAGMLGGSIEVRGNAGAFAATGLRDGRIHITGNAADFIGAALPGDHQGMRGGVVIVDGNVGDRAGDRMRRGALLIQGNTGDYCASRMVAGTIAVWGTVGRSPGLSMRRGTLLLRQAPPALLPTFNESGTFTFTFLTLLARAWRGLPGPFAGLPESGMQVRRFMGDLANDGRGEILLRA